tara:strand:- start:1121 stop:2383 length:1263 start_codon:yes stop_codon:yes gene_type:complete
MLEVSTNDLFPYANNARTHSAAQLAQVAASIKEFGFTNPILIDENNVIIAGHGRLEAAKLLGMETVPVRVLDNLTNDQKKAYVIADNQLALNAGWDIELLKVELEELKLNDFDLSLTGFDEDFIAGLLHQDTEGLTDEDAVPEPPEVPVSVLGDLWVLGNHRLMCGDSTSIDDVGKLTDGGKIDAVVTSPPYNQGNTKGDLFSHGKRVEALYENDFDNKTKNEYFDFCIDVLNAISSVLSNNHVVVWNVSYNAKSRDDYGKILFSEKNPFTVKETISWNKGGSINLPQVGIYSRKCELIFVMSSYDGYLTSQIYGDCRWNSWETKKINQRIDHKATFTVELSDRAVDEFSFESNNILDPFGGSGTTMISCEKKNRNCYMMELDPKYCDVIINRWQDFTGKEAVHESGETFNAMKNKRMAA